MLIATPLYPPDIGGPASYVALVEHGLKERDFSVEVVPFSRVRGLPRVIRHLQYFFLVFQAARGKDVVFALDTISVGLPAAVAAWLSSTPLVLRLGGLGSWERATEQHLQVGAPHEFAGQLRLMTLRIRILAAIERWVLGRAAVVIAQGTYQKRVLEGWGVEHSRVQIVYNGIASIPQATMRARERLTILSAGRLVELKRFDVLIEAVGLLRERLPGVRLVIYGDGPSRNDLAKRIREAALGDSVRLCPPLPRAELLDEMGTFSAFALASSHETFSNLIIEAMATGTPVVATAVGGTPEIIIDGENGRIVPPGDAAALAAALERVLGDPAYAQGLARNARKVLSRFSQEAVMEGTLRALRQALR